MKRFMGYLFYTLFVGVIMYWGFILGQNLRIQAGRTFHPFPLYIFMALYPIVIGMVLAVPGLFQRIRQDGKWRIDWQMLLPVGIPTFLYNINLVLSLLIQRPLLFKYDWYKFMLTDPRSLDISGIVCGYVLLSSWIRTPSDEEKDLS
ncbi:hypothetical protein UF75_3347 [Desulfosporosinus sp. I2]|uniref:hypothetical protein n=1 Tax=Desulfosporosinus sp. I2 TaxID=1617025 RepID=UPI0005F0B9DB|nr:hypothetical protein [Desulfosporosinus sp. I2]KJR46261.1 hypothetical protein UF75_3347 [Desulfosporosinus sp. I2]